MNSLPWEDQKAFFAFGQRFPELASYLPHDLLMAVGQDNKF